MVQATTGRTVGGSTVTINGIASNFNSSTVANGIRFIVTSTGSGQVYNYHKATLKEDDLVSLSGDINDFSERYRVLVARTLQVLLIVVIYSLIQVQVNFLYIMELTQRGKKLKVY